MRTIGVGDALYEILRLKTDRVGAQNYKVTDTLDADPSNLRFDVDQWIKHQATSDLVDGEVLLLRNTVVGSITPYRVHAPQAATVTRIGRL